MELGLIVAAVFAILIFIAGISWLIDNAVQRHRQGKAAERFDHGARAEFWLDALGPLTADEKTALLRFTLFEISNNGAVGWEGMQTNAAFARRFVREGKSLRDEQATKE
tara:strand:- start:59204 stop:59530 length:327 start_codon:yes stop_codon:yes gene_type:complete